MSILFLEVNSYLGVKAEEILFASLKQSMFIYFTSIYTNYTEGKY